MSSSVRSSEGRVTVKQLAAEAGVSIATVSVVLNDRADAIGISQKTRARVLEVSRKLNYVPNQSARHLRGKREPSVGVVWFLAAPQSSQTLGLLSACCQERGYRMHLTPYLRSMDDLLEAVEDFSRRRMDALVVHLAEPETLTDPRLLKAMSQFSAVVLVGTRKLERPFDQVRHDFSQAVRQVADYSVDTGRVRPAVVSTPAANAGKVQAYLDQLAQRGLRVDESSVVAIPHSRVSPFHHHYRLDHLTPYLEERFGGRPFPFDALFCTTDILAASVGRWLRGRGVKLPGEVALVGFDDIDANLCFDPPLASVTRHDEAMLKAVVDLLFTRLARPSAKRMYREIFMSFEWRASAGKQAPPSSSSSQRMETSHAQLREMDHVK
jgi:LacI family transcriptional regulator